MVLCIVVTVITTIVALCLPVTLPPPARFPSPLAFASLQAANKQMQSMSTLFPSSELDKKLSEANVNVHYKVNNDLKVATSSNHSASSPLGGFTVGASLATAAGTW